MKNIVILPPSKPQFLRAIGAMLSFFCIIAGSTSRAEVYSFIDEEGAICFTDTPRFKGPVRVYHDRKGLTRKTSSGTPSAKGRSGREISLERGVLSDTVPTDMTLPVEGRISSTVGLRHDPIDGLLRFHDGVDIAVPEGTPVKPVAPGTVYFSGPRGGYGNMVIISHDDGMITIYAHNSLLFLQEGDRVEKETTVALSGSTGRSTGPHLHFEAWKNGSNVTEAFLGDIAGGQNAVADARPGRDNIRRALRADGSILFTNLP